ncbi:hypothetical protein [Agrobacterium pusense]|uniref:hypothetical protein n=1 Tax=Agrobacterium pusense TaxID=648995 RepID=UPI000D1BF8E4|nr:hypothetical protein [Agrobacterium pusense]
MIISDEKTVRLSEASAGDLVRLQIREHSLYGIVLGQERSRTVVGALQPLPDRVAHPFHFTPSNENYVVSYGSEWYIEIVPGDEFFAGNTDLRWASGALSLQGEEWIITFLPSPNDHEHAELYYNLSINELTESPTRESAKVGRWRIWKSASSFANQRESALIEVEAVKVG